MLELRMKLLPSYRLQTDLVVPLIMKEATTEEISVVRTKD